MLELPEDFVDVQVIESCWGDWWLVQDGRVRAVYLVSDEDDGGSDCIYYNDKGGEVGDFFQLCFDKSGGKLESKSAF